MQEVPDDVLAEIDFLVRSANRVRLLDELRQCERAHRDELRTACEASRTTVQRNLDALEERGWIRSTNHHYTTTSSGELIGRKLPELLETVQVANRLEPIEKWLPVSEIDVDLPTLGSASTIVTTDPSDPYAPVNRHIGAMRSADRFRCLLPAVGLQPMMVARDCVRRGRTHELVVDRPVAETLRADPDYEEILTDMEGSERFDMYRYDGEFPIYLGLADDVVQIGVEDDDGIPRGLLEYDPESLPMRKWAERTYDEYKRESEAFRPFPD